MISTVGMLEPPQFFSRFSPIIAYHAKMFWLTFMLTAAFLYIVAVFRISPELIIVQSPPAIPSLSLCYIYSKFLKCDLIIDWHNYGFSELSMMFSRDSPILQGAIWLETYFAKKGTYNLCATRAMKHDLKDRMGLSAVSLYDRSPPQFRPLLGAEQTQFLEELCNEYYPELCEKLIGEKRDDGSGTRKCGIIVGGSSWTKYEDFGVFLNALERYEEVKMEDEEFNKYPDLVVFITGKGPMKEHYREQIEDLHLEHVRIYLTWVEHEHYPKLLGCADLGISLHSSSSGLDLPMKIVDMFGSGVPVCSVGSAGVEELVKHDNNGWIFQGSADLGNRIKMWFKGYPSKSNENHTKFRNNLREFQKVKWHENWLRTLRPILTKEK